jgi:integrase
MTAAVTAIRTSIPSYVPFIFQRRKRAIWFYSFVAWSVVDTDRGSLLGKRDYAMIAMMVGSGLRRGELLALPVDSIQSREEHWVIADLLWKAGHIRTVPIPSWVKVALDEWKEAALIAEGALFRSINKAGRVWGTGMTPKVCGR